MKSTPTNEEIKQAVSVIIETIKAVGEAIREVGSVPSGHLYAQLSGVMDLDKYQKIIGALKKAGVVKEENFVLTWIGPAK